MNGNWISKTSSTVKKKKKKEEEKDWMMHVLCSFDGQEAIKFSQRRTKTQFNCGSVCGHSDFNFNLRTLFFGQKE